LFCVVSTATVTRLGLFDPGVMPVTVPVVGVTLVTAVPVTGTRAALVKNDPDVVVVFTLVKALPTVGVTAVSAVPVCPVTPFTTLVDVVPRVAPVRNDPGVVCTPVKAVAIVGITDVNRRDGTHLDVTTGVPGGPGVIPFTTLAEVELTPVTHVSAQAVDNSAAFRLTTLTVSRRRGQSCLSLQLIFLDNVAE
jgi:hypothetical protein